MRFTRPIKAAAALTLNLAVFCQPVIAHTPYIAPTSFDTVMASTASFDASFAESFFVPEAAFNNSVFTVTSPTGETTSPSRVVKMKTRIVVEQTMEEEGTYRISTGVRKGAEFIIYDLDGKEKRAMNPKKALPNGAKIKQHFQSITRADTYVSYKKPSNDVLKIETEGYQLQPLSNPTEIFSGEAFNLKISLDGKNMADQKLLVYKASADEKSKPITFSSNDKGIAALTLPAGEYLIRARHRGPAAKGSRIPTLSYTSTLSIKVFQNI